MIWHYDAAAAHTDALGGTGHMADQHRGGGAGDPLNAVMLGEPEAGKAQALGQLGQSHTFTVAVGGAATLADGGQIENGQGSSGEARHDGSD